MSINYLEHRRRLTADNYISHKTSRGTDGLTAPSTCQPGVHTYQHVQKASKCSLRQIRTSESARFPFSQLDLFLCGFKRLRKLTASLKWVREACEQFVLFFNPTPFFSGLYTLHWLGSLWSDDLIPLLRGLGSLKSSQGGISGEINELSVAVINKNPPSAVGVRGLCTDI